ncbi:MAG TPA: aspartate aminotransferase family protein [Nitrososphaeraceae archaeon]|nr:aspartate aminotransferase family protein [Nitrososphaeraceae archaeon]
MITNEDSFLINLYQRFPVTVERAQGATIWDTDGKEYIDCMGGYGVAIIGHCNKDVINAITLQMNKLMVCHMSTYNDSRLQFLSKLNSIAPENLSRIFFSNSGAESIEAALKFSRKFSQKGGIISMYGGYHGKTFGALSVTYNSKYRKSFNPLLEGIKFVPFGDISSLIDAIDESIGTVILEPIQGESGIIMPPDGYVKAVREICTEKKLVLIFDEIQTGLGRTGKMWAGQNWTTVPDIMCIAKGIASGIPTGVTFVKDEIAKCMNLGEHSSTFAGNPITCSAGTATIDTIIKEDLVTKASDTGTYFKKKLIELKEKHPIIRDVRGMGMMLALESRFDIRDILMDGIRNGLLMLYSGRTIIRLLPPLVMKKEQVSRAIEIMDKILSLEEKRRNVKN